MNGLIGRGAGAESPTETFAVPGCSNYPQALPIFFFLVVDTPTETYNFPGMCACVHVCMYVYKYIHTYMYVYMCRL